MPDIPLSTNLMSRDGTTTRDSKMANAYGEGRYFTKRPGLTLDSVTEPGAAQLIACWRGRTIAITTDTLVDAPQATQTADLESWSVVGASPPTFGTISSGRQRVTHSDGYVYLVGIGATNASVFRTLDGITWTSRYTGGWASGSLGAARYNGTVVSFNSKLYLIGGTDGTNATNHVWSSSDGGTTWNQEANGGFSTRHSHSSVVFDGYIWVFGGFHSPTYLNDVWRTADGTTWEQVTASAVWTACTVAAEVFDNKIFLLGGSNGSGGSVQAWYSSNGVSWTRATDVPIANVFTYVYGGNIVLSNSTSATYVSHDNATTWQTLTGTPVTFKNIYPIGQSVWFGTTGNNYAADITGYGSGSSAIATGAPLEPFDSSQTSLSAGNNYLFFKTTRDAWYYNGSTVTKVTDADYPAETVPGVVYLDGYFFVMQPDGTIQNSAIGDPAAWAALDFLNAEMEPDDGVALGKSQNYLVAFGEWTTEFFYNTANPTGSPLTRMPNAAQKVGCASGRSLVELNSQLYWMGKTVERGRQVFRMNGLQPEVVSTPDVERILNEAGLDTVRSFGLKIGGHALYGLNLVSDGITLVYDANTQLWSEWTALTAGSAKTVSSITQSNGLATATTTTAHGMSDGDVFKISGANQSGYNLTAIARVTDTDEVQFECASGTVSPATGTITLTPYTESYFPYSAYTHCKGKDLLLHESSGKIYEVSPSTYQDDGIPIHVMSRVGPYDDQTQFPKPIGEVSMFAERATAHGFIRMSSDDGQSWIKARRLDLSIDRPRVRRLGSPVRAMFEFHHVDNAPLRAESLSVMVG